MLGEIIDKATRLIPRFMDIAKSLGLDMDDVNGLTGLAGLLVYGKWASDPVNHVILLLGFLLL